MRILHFDSCREVDGVAQRLDAFLALLLSCSHQVAKSALFCTHTHSFGIGED